jgi:hypothetical protein
MVEVSNEIVALRTTGGGALRAMQAPLPTTRAAAILC